MAIYNFNKYKFSIIVVIIKVKYSYVIKLVMNIDIKEIIESIASVNKLSEEDIIKTLEKCFFEAWESIYGEGYELFLKIENNKLNLYRKVITVKEIEDIKTEIIGEEEGIEVIEKLDITAFPRHLILNIYENIQKEIKNVHKDREYSNYYDKVGQLFRCQVTKSAGRFVVLKVDNEYTGCIPNYYFNQRERLFPGDFVQCRLAEVKQNYVDHQLMFERKTYEFLKLLLAEFIPEIASGAITIKSIARNPGEIAKVLVDSDGTVNAVGACLGMKGKRRLDIIKELNGEKVDFIRFYEDINKQIKEYFSHKKIDILYTIEIEEDSFEIVVTDEKIPEVIGKAGQNIFLVKSLLHKQIKVIGLTEFQERENTKIEKLAEDMINFGINKEQAIFILRNFYNLDDVQYSDEVTVELKEKVLEYIKYQNKKEKEDFVKLGGNIDFFLSIKGIPNYVYFELLNAKIKSISDLENIKTIEELQDITGLDRDICLLLKEKCMSSSDV